MSELTKEDFEQILTDKLAPLATKQDVREGVEELARITSSGFARMEKRLDVTDQLKAIEVKFQKLEEALQVLQKNEERLRFWGVERSDDPNLAGDLLQEFGLWLDRRAEFPRKAAGIGVPSERPVSASALAPVRRVLADVIAQERPTDRAAIALGE